MVKEGQKGDTTYRAQRKAFPINKKGVQEIDLHRPTGGGARGAAAPPNFGQLRFFGQQEKIWAKPAFNVCN